MEHQLTVNPKMNTRILPWNYAQAMSLPKHIKWHTSRLEGTEERYLLVIETELETASR